MTIRHPILVVDDEPVNLRVLEKLLSDQMQVNVATTGEEAIRIAEQSPPDLILLDVMMSGIDGFTVCQQIRANPRLAHARIIMVSGKSTVEQRLKGYQAGADDYVVKPFVADELLAKVKVNLSLVSAERALKNLNAQLEEQVRIRTDQLVRAERSAFLGAHAAEIVHNLNNPLAVVMGSIKMLSREIPDNPRLQKADRAVGKIHEIIRTILQANRHESVDEQDVDLNQVLKEELMLVEIGNFSSKEIHTKLDLGEIPPVKGHAVHFSQSFGNLIKNSVDAMHDSSRKELMVSSREKSNYIEIEISDTGSGISPANLAKIFDPFFTTKPLEANTRGEPVGNGLGLPSVKRMLSAFGGSIEFESSVGVGTTARVKVPVKSPRQASMVYANYVGPEGQRFQIASMPINEPMRLQALYALRLLDTPREQLFDDLTLLAATICDTPVSTISLIDGQRQWFKASVGLGEVREASRDTSFCSHTILGTEPFVIEDTLEDERFAANPHVLGAPHIRFYAGVPLIVARDYAVGTICVMDSVPRKLSGQRIDCLKAISRQVAAHLDHRKLG